MNIEDARDLYSRDPEFHQIVDVIYHGMVKMDYTASELRAAAMLAAYMFETTHIRPLVIKKDDIS